MTHDLTSPSLLPTHGPLPRVVAWRGGDGSVRLAYHGTWSLARSVREIQLGYALWDPDHGVLFHWHSQTKFTLEQLQAAYAEQPAAHAVDTHRHQAASPYPVYLPTGVLCAAAPHALAVTLVDRGWAVWRDPRHKMAGLWVADALCTSPSGSVSAPRADAAGFPADWASRHAPDPGDVMTHWARRLAADRTAALALAAWFQSPVPTASPDECHYHVACAGVMARHRPALSREPDPEEATAAVARWVHAIRDGRGADAAFLAAFADYGPAGKEQSHG